MVKFYCRKDRRRYKLEDIKTKCCSCELGHGCNAYAPVMRLTGSEDLRTAHALNLFLQPFEDKLLQAIRDGDDVAAASLERRILQKQQKQQKHR